MKSGKYLALGILALLVLIAAGGLVLAGNSETKTINAEYDFNNSNLKIYGETINSNYVLLSVETDKKAKCKYSDSGRDFSFEEGFDLEPNAEKLSHEKVFDTYKLENRRNNYYVKCVKESQLEKGNYSKPSVLEIEFKVDKKVRAKIYLPQGVEPPLSSGKHEIELETSEPTQGKPSLSYYLDDGSSHKISLSEVRGEDNIWKGYLIISEDIGDDILSFEFKAEDLRGNEGTEITQNEILEIDTITPDPISDIRAIGKEGKVKLKWHYGGEDADFNIYRSKSRDVDKTDFYEETDDSDFTDTFVEAGKKYYYKVAPIDEAGNEARLSLEVSSTALSENSSEEDTGLAQGLRGNVENFITQTDSLISQISGIKDSTGSLSEDKKEIFSLLDLEDKLDSAASKTKSLKRNVESYKQQDLTESELDSKLDSAETKLNVIKKSIPEEVSVKEKDTQNNEIKEKDIETALLETRPEMSSSLREKSVERSLEVIEEKNIEIKTNFYVGEINYFDGSTKDISVVKRTINSNLGPHSNMSFLEIVPKEVTEYAEDIDFVNSDYEVVKQDPIISFSSDVKQIAYSLEKEVSLDSLKETKPVFVSVFEEEKSRGIGITGNFVRNVDGTYVGVGIGILIVGFLFLYLFYLRKNKLSPEGIEIKNLMEKAKKKLDKGELKESINIYKDIKEKYNSLNKKDKSKVYDELQEIFAKIQASKLKKGIKEFEKNKDKGLFNKLYSIYKSLPENYKKKFSQFEKLKKDMQNED